MSSFIFSALAPTEILGLAEGGYKGGRLLRISVSGIQVCDAGGPAILHHLQRGGGCGDATLVCSDGGGRGRAERERTRGQAPKCPLLHE